MKAQKTLEAGKAAEKSPNDLLKVNAEILDLLCS